MALSADGNTALVGGNGDNDHVGAVWVFTRDSSGNWSQQGNKLVGSGAVNGVAPDGANQGYSVALSGDGNTALVGGPFDYPSVPFGTGSIGAAWVLTRDSSGNWSQQGNKLVGSGASGLAWQGSSVALSSDGNTAVVGGPHDGQSGPFGNGTSVGAVWVFTRDSSGNWSQQGNKLVGSGAVNGATQGYSVALSGDGNTVWVSGPGDAPDDLGNTTGAAWVFTRDSSGNWSQQGNKLVGAGGAVALSGDGNTALVGYPGDSEIGAAWVFTRDSSGNWSQLGDKLVGTGAVPGDVNVQQGSAVGLSADGNTALVGGWADNPHVGATWVFVRLTAAAPSITSSGIVPVRSTAR